MKTFLVAQHHGTFLTLKSLMANNIEDVTIIIPGSQVDKYNKMYNDNKNNPEFKVFEHYDKRISAFLKENNLNYKAYVVDDFDIRNTFVSTLKVIKDLGCNQIVSCLLSGVVVNKDYRPFAKEAILLKTYGMCYSRVYHNHPHLSMYHMLGLKASDPALDLNFYIVDMSKVADNSLSKSDSQLLTEAMSKKLVTILVREFNGKDDPLIGQAISARQTIAHNLKIQSGFIVNLWNKSIKNNDSLKSEELYGYPFNILGRYVVGLQDYLPSSTVNRIMDNSAETQKLTSGLYQCLDIIDL